MKLFYLLCLNDTICHVKTWKKHLRILFFFFQTEVCILADINRLRKLGSAYFHHTICSDPELAFDLVSHIHPASLKDMRLEVCTFLQFTARGYIATVCDTPGKKKCL